jgi:hypothetical protein
MRSVKQAILEDILSNPDDDLASACLAYGRREAAKIRKV